MGDQERLTQEQQEALEAAIAEVTDRMLADVDRFEDDGGRF